MMLFLHIVAIATLAALAALLAVPQRSNSTARSAALPSIPGAGTPDAQHGTAPDV